MLSCSLSNATIKYETLGEGSPLIVLHGAGPIDHQYMMYDFEPLFRQRSGWRRIYIDLPGHGQTLWPEWVSSPDQIIDLLCEFIDHTIPDRPFTLAGLSWGGALSLGILNRRAEMVEGIFLSVPAVIMDRSKRTLPDQINLIQDPEFVAELQEDEKWITEYLVVQDSTFLNRLREQIFSVDRKNAKLGVDLDLRQAQFSYNADQIYFDKPTLILSGRQDRAVGYKDSWDLLENFPRATYAVLDRAGHFLSIEQRTLMQALINEWLNRVEEYRSK